MTSSSGTFPGRIISCSNEGKLLPILQLMKTHYFVIKRHVGPVSRLQSAKRSFIIVLFMPYIIKQLVSEHFIVVHLMPLVLYMSKYIYNMS